MSTYQFSTIANMMILPKSFFNIVKLNPRSNSNYEEHLWFGAITCGQSEDNKKRIIKQLLRRR